MFDSIFSLSFYFNPRSLAGATPTIKSPTGTGFISIHAPSRERHGRLCYDRKDLYFNPRSLAGATVLFVQLDAGFDYFNPRSLAGATSIAAIGTRASYFNPRSLAGATYTKLPSISSTLAFQSTLPRGSDNCAQYQR